MAWTDAGQRLAAMPTVRTGCDFAVSNRPAVSTPTTAAGRGRYQSLTASGMIYDHLSANYPQLDTFSPFDTMKANEPKHDTHSMS